MYASMWTYPWDLLDLGMDNALSEMRDHGLTGVSLITSYHAGRFLQVRSPRRKIYFPEDGVLYYPSDLSRFRGGLIQPKVGRFIREHPTFWEELHATAERRGMTVSGWTVCLHNTRIGMEHPEVCVHNAYGDVIFYNQCPAHPEVRAYMRRLLEDIAGTLPLHAIELESMNYMGHAHEYHHEKDGIGLTQLEDFLFSLCFCDACVARAKAEGVDILPAKALVKGWLDDICLRDKPSDRDAAFLAKGMAYFEDTPEVMTYLRWRSTVVTSLMEEAHQAVAGRSKLYFLSLLPHSRSWLFGVDLKAISGLCEGAVVCSYESSTAQAVADLSESRRDFAEGADLLTGMRAFYPEYSGYEAFAEKVRAAHDQGVEGYLFYNYGLIPPVHLGWVRDALAALR